MFSLLVFTSFARPSLQAQTTGTLPPQPIFSEATGINYQDEIERNVRLLSSHLNWLAANKEAMTDEQFLRKVENALNLFSSPLDTVEISFRGSRPNEKQAAQDYLYRYAGSVGQKYDKITLEWDPNKTEILSEDPQGAVVRVLQEFEGLKNGRVLYKDLTEKEVSISIVTEKLPVTGDQSVPSTTIKVTYIKADKPK